MRYLILVFILILSACQTNSPSVKEIDMYNSSGDMIGTANLTEQSDGVKIEIEVEGLAPGFHGVHIHEHAKCEGPDFKSAGNHLNPDGSQHGLMHPDGPHLGDLPNVEADSSGKVTDELIASEATLKDTKKSILANEGTSLIITEGQDDGVSQPGGDSGQRIACGLIQQEDNSENEEPPTDPTQVGDEEDE